MALIYIVLNQINGKVYIGQHAGARLTHRWLEHQRHAKNGSTHPFHRAIRKYGGKAFTLCALSTSAASKVDLDHQEIFFTEKYRSNDPKYGYNITKGGWGNSGFKHSEETRKRIGDSNRGKTRHHGPHSVETRKKISDSWKRPGRHSSMLGRHHSEESKRKSSVAPGHRSVETRKKLSLAASKRKLSEATKEKIRSTVLKQPRSPKGFFV